MLLPCAQRREQLRPMLRELGLDGLLISSAANRYYLSGFELHDTQCNECAGYVLMRNKDGGREDWLLTDSRYEDAALRLWPKERLFIYAAPYRKSIRDFLKGLFGAGKIGFESEAMHVGMHQFLTTELLLAPTQGLVEGLRVRKDKDEIAAMERSAAVNHEVFARLPALLIPGKTERQLAWEIEVLFHELGASEISFASIVGVGPNAALPHAIPGETVIEENQLVLVDIGGRVDDYCSDQTRTFWVGDTPSDRFKETLERVQGAQTQAIAAIRPGVAMNAVYQVARQHFAQFGVEDRFTHGLGHGIGLETHEPPRLSALPTEPLKSGMLVTVEPGLYYPDWGGVRWEHMVLVTPDGCRVL
jgi:Xaa-Pro aminopeptidase